MHLSIRAIPLLNAALLFTALILPGSLFAGTLTGTVRGPDSTSAGIAGAKVVLTKSTGGQGSTRTPIDSMVADAKGVFSFANLPTSNNYGLTASATGFQTVSMNRLAVDSAATVTVNVTLPLPYPPASIMGTVRGPDSTGPLLPNLMVVLNKPGTGNGSRVNVDSVKTDAQGKFLFANLPAAENYGIDIAAQAGVVRAYSDHNIDLRGVNDTENVVMEPPPGPGTIMGRVTGPDTTKPLVGQLVVLTKSVSPSDSNRIHVDSVKTDALGKYEFKNIPAYTDYGILVASSDTTLRVSNRSGLSVDRDTVIRNVTLRAVAAILGRALAAQGIDWAWNGEGLSLRFAPLAGDRRLILYDASGAVRYRAVIPSGTTHAVIPEAVAGRPGLLASLLDATTQRAFRLPSPR